MADVSKEVAQSELQTIRSFAQVLYSFWMNLATYLEEHAKTQAQREMARYIRGGGQMGAYQIRGTGDITGELKMRLEEEGICYINSTEPSVIFIREPDLMRIQEINKEINIARCNYFQEVDAEKLEAAIAKSDFIKEKGIISLNGLDKYEAEVLKNKCNNITKGFMVGTKKNPNGTIDLSIRADMVSSDKKIDFCKAYLLANLSLYGINHETKKKQIEEDEIIDRALSQTNLTENVIYVTGSHDENKRQYIEINNTGFKFHQIYKDSRSGKWIEKSNEDNAEFSFKDPNAKEELWRAMDRIYDKTIVTDIKGLEKYITSGISNGRTSRKNKDQVLYSQGEKDIAEVIDKMIDSKISEDDIHFESNDQLFNYYKNEAGKIMSYLAEGEPVEGYKNGDLQILCQIAQDKRMDLSKYTKVAEKLVEKTADIHVAEIKKTKERENEEIIK